MLKGGDGKVTQKQAVGGNAGHKKLRRDEWMEKWKKEK